MVGVVAMAGTGKSRLGFEFLERCRARGMRVFEGRAELAEVLGDDAARVARLGEAQEGYAGIGAPKHAERLARELAL